MYECGDRHSPKEAMEDAAVCCAHGSALRRRPLSSSWVTVGNRGADLAATEPDRHRQGSHNATTNMKYGVVSTIPTEKKNTHKFGNILASMTMVAYWILAASLICGTVAAGSVSTM